LQVTTSSDNTVIIYNRIPKTGSTSFIKVVNHLYKENHFSSLYLNITSKTMLLTDEAWIVKNISLWKGIRPVIIHGHFGFPHFAKFGSPLRPIFINILRDPLQRFVSYYYFIRYGDDFRPHKKRSRMGDRTTLDECVKKEKADCKPEKLWLQVPYFCGFNPRCWAPGNRWALDQAKRHLADSYFLVGISEEMEKFIRALDYTLPGIFKGATKKYLKDGGIHVRKTKQKNPVSKETIEYYKKSKIWRLENEFYQFARGIFLKQYNAMFEKKDDKLLFRKSKIIYQNVKVFKPSPP